MQTIAITRWMLKANSLVCVREERTIFADLSFELQAGQIVQIAGPNGSGKTSLLRILSGLSQAAQGEILWQGQSVQQLGDSYQQDMLYLGHHAGVKAELSPHENLQFYAGLAGQQASYQHYLDILLKVGLAGYEDVPVVHLSAGQQRRVALARLWLEQRSLWILDEPFTAIDKQGVKYLEKHIQQHAQQGGIVLLTTHQDLSLATAHYQVIDMSDYKPEYEY